jgi:hypothetical protein
MSSPQQRLAAASETQLQQLRRDPRLYVRNCWRHPNDQGRQYDFKTTDGEDVLHYLTDDHGPLNPEQWGGINILLMARGLLKTTTLQAITNWAFQFYGPHGFEEYMAAPRDDQTTEFVAKLREKFEWSGLTQYRTKNAISHQKFEFDLDGRTTYSHFKSDSGWGRGDAMRGPHSHLGIYDEFQDASAKSFNAGFYEVIDQEIAGVPYFPVMFLMGTPKMEGSFFEEMWKRSDQREWRPDRGENGEWVAEAEAESYGNGSDSVDVRGWRVDQQRAPLHSDAQIAAKRDMKDEQEFMNEVMAQFYSPEDHLLSERHVDAIIDPTERLVTTPRDPDNWITVGVDWGGGSDRKAADTVVSVMEHVEYEDGTTESVLDRVDFLDESLSKSDEFEHLEKRILQFDPDRVVVDEGYGAKRREDLQRGNGTMDGDGYDTVVGCRFGNISTTDKVKWKDRDDKDLFTADKSHVAKSFVDFVKAQRLVIPSKQLDTGTSGRDQAAGTKLYRQLTAPYEEKRETKSGRKKSTITSKSSDNDDAFDALLYSWLAYHMDALGPTHTARRFSSHSAPGSPRP